MRKHLIVFIVVMMVLASIGFSAVKVGEPVIEKFDSPHPYKGAAGVVWEKIFHYPNAGYVSIHFSKFDLAPGDYLEIFSGDEQVRYAYKGKGKVVNGGAEVISDFWATHIPGDIAVVRLHSQNPDGGWGVEIDQWVRGFEKGRIDELLVSMESDLTDPGPEALCSNDDKEWAKCYSGTEIYNKSRAVARLLMNGSSACTGWLIGSEGHLMTNNHCIGTQTTANNTDFEFMAEGSTCGTDCSSWFACPGTVEATSATLIQTDSALDYTLVLLPTNVSGTYGYLQLRDTLPNVGERIYLPQHPSAYGKMIAVTSDVDGGYAEVYSTNETPCSGGPGDIGYYADTAGGSSGSPVLGYSDHLVISLHHCANCPNRGVPIPAIISDLGGNIPANAIGGGGTPTTPAAPSNLTAKGKRGKAILSWDDNANNETGFYVYRGLTSGSLSLVATLGANSTTFTDNGLANKTTYYYKVCAYNTEGESCSATISVRTK
jgi:Trypsin-like peptidase domain